MVEWFGSVLGCCEHLITPPPSCLKLGILFLVQAEGGGLGGAKTPVALGRTKPAWPHAGGEYTTYSSA